ncbi:phosphate signaling complex protein PhoU [Litorimonas sp. RW-G-Af-16]|uniref:phosphate signaling complex protein PhoU n=1 Tax=Litorimonas sp. RW-G-Af-16 TaxID=3241168 RepID=UPI00390C7586
MDRTEHIVSGYDTELTSLMTDIYALGDIVSFMTSDAVRALKKENSELARKVIDRDVEANLLQAKVDASAVRILALRHPMATDLRRVISATRMSADFERIGDLAEGIARRTLTVNDEKSLKLTKSISRMGKAVAVQLNNCLTALRNEDEKLAIEIWIADEDIDDIYNSLFRELLTVMMSDQRKIETCTALLFIAKNLERIGDHVTNICEAIYYTETAQQLIHDPDVEELITTG